MDELIIEADRAERQYWRDLRSYRELFMFLAWRDLLVRYKQTVAGAIRSSNESGAVAELSSFELRSWRWSMHLPDKSSEQEDISL
jgi:hypothetical protein